MSKYTSAFLNPFLQLGDPSADEVIAQLFKENRRDIFQKIARAEVLNPNEYPDYLANFIEQNSFMPAWSDRQKIEEGRLFFKRYTEQNLLILWMLSLPYCYAGADVAEVLVQTKEIEKQTKKRVIETAQFLLMVMQDDAFEPQSQGMSAILKVRLIHASIRFHLMQKNWQQKKNRIPINQEEMAETNLAFSFIVLRGLRKLGIALQHREAESFMHLWRVIGYFSGVNEEILPKNQLEASRLDEAIAKRHFRASKAGKLLTHALLNYIYDSKFFSPLDNFPPNLMRYLLGNEIADMLNVPPETWESALVTPYKWRSIFKNTLNYQEVPNDDMMGWVIENIRQENGWTNFPIREKIASQF